MHNLWLCRNYKGTSILPHTHQYKLASCRTVQDRLRTKRGHFDYSSKVTCFTQSSPHFGCKLNVGYGLESWAGFLSEYQYAEAVLLHQLSHLTRLFNEINSGEISLSIYIYIVLNCSHKETHLEVLDHLNPHHVSTLTISWAPVARSH